MKKQSDFSMKSFDAKENTYCIVVPSGSSTISAAGSGTKLDLLGPCVTNLKQKKIHLYNVGRHMSTSASVPVLRASSVSCLVNLILKSSFPIQ